jgi:CHAT domain-containing protein
MAALLAPSGRYAVEDYRLRVTPAIALLVRPSSTSVTGPAIIAGAPTGSGLPALPGAEREVQGVRAILGGDPRMFTGPRLLSESLTAEAPKARLLHLATHAVIDETQPLASYLALAGRSRLTTEAIYRWRMQADLVMLSACRGASGRVAADGLLGFPRAFLYAGAASVVAPLADIPDETTVRLVEEFYRHYAKGRGKAESLRAAQLKLLADLRAGRVHVTTPAGSMALPEHPGLWAAFVLMGGD